VHVNRGTQQVTARLSGLSGIRLWSPGSPKLYTVRTTLGGPSAPAHSVETTIGFREASFKLDGFYLNGSRLELFGLNRHQMFPYTGMAAPQRLQARDALLIKDGLGCNMVRCSHYPQSPHFLDECDRVGLMVWEEPPGWQYVGDPNFDRAFLQNVHDMVVRDRNRPSVIVWATRPDETGGYPTLYGEARQLAYDLDGTRQTTGAIDVHTTQAWAEDVFAYDDYHTDGKGNAILEPPIPGVPYMVSEAVGAIDGPPLYRWIDSSQTLATQARLHAQVHEIARSNPAYAGLLAWCAVDYASLVGGGRVWENLRWPGVLDIFRVAKPGAAFYQSQHSPAQGPVIVPAFYWDFGPGSPPTGPGPNSMLATNCERLVISVGGVVFATVTPDTADYGNLPYPPAIVDLTIPNGSTLPDLRVDGYIGSRLVTTLQMSSNPAGDHLGLVVDDASIVGDGTDATRVTFRALDAYGNQRPYVSGNVTLGLRGPAELVAQNPFAFGTYGGVGGAFIRSRAGRTGKVTITASHPTLGHASGQLRVTAASAPAL
jgi:beta-galactosidase